MEKELRNITLRRLTTFWKKVKKFIDTKANSENYDYSLDYFTTVNVDKIAGTFNVYVGANEPLSYSLDDGVTWVTMSDGTAGRKATPSIKPGEKVLWKNTNIYPVHYMAMTSPKIDSTIEFAILGNLMSLLFGDDFIKDTYVITNTGSTNFAYFFGLKLKYAHNLIFPKSISSTDQYVHTMYGNMFTSCSGLITSPKELSNIICAGLYSGMFSGCTSLTSTPILPYTNITTNCYSGMFYGCTSLTKAPDLPATAAAIGCYANMFVNCTSLKEASLINLEGLAAFMCMYQMFKGCTSLIKGPDTLKLTSLSGYTIPGGSTVVGCYESMFEGCTSLIEAPDILAASVANSEFRCMFMNCTSLKHMPYMALIRFGARLSHYLMFKGCTSLQEANIQGVGTGQGISYQCTSMFEGCTSLTKATVKVGASGAGNFNNMFKGCTNLSFIEGFFGTPPTNTSDWVNGVATTGIFIKNDNASWDVIGDSGVPFGWTVYKESEWEVVRHYELGSYYTKPNGGIPKTDLSTDVQTSLGKADTALQSFTESDPTVPSWAKQPSKPSYTASEVGALPDTTKYAGSQSVGGAADKAESIFMATIDAATSTSSAYVANVQGLTRLKEGTCIFLRVNTASAYGATLKVNDFDAKPIHTSLSSFVVSGNTLKASSFYFFVYTETIGSGAWVMSAGYDSNDTAQFITHYQGQMKMKETSNGTMLLVTYSDTELLPIYSGTKTDATTKVLTNESFNPFGNIFYGAGTLNKNSYVNFSYLWQQFYFDLSYSFNIGTTLTSRKNVYMVCVPQSDGRVKLTSNPISQDLPTTEDGYVYIYLGVAWSDKNITLFLNHPIYYFKDGAIRQWTGEDSRISALEARNDSTYGVVRQTITFTDVAGQGKVKAISDVEHGYIPNMFIKMATLGKGMATFNSTTGYFELNGLTDISYEEMVVIYNETKDMLKLGQASQFAILSHSNARTNLTTNNENNQLRSQKMTFSYGFQYSNLEVLNLDLNFGEGDETKTVVIGKSGFSSTFISCDFLRTILGKIDVSIDNAMFNYDNNGQSYTFQACTSLENIQLYGLRQNVSFRYCQPLSVESILYMINNEAATGAIRITLNTYAYQRAIVNADIVASTQNHPLITLADYTTGNTFNNGVETTA